MGYRNKNPQTIHIDNPNIEDLKSSLAENAKVTNGSKYGIKPNTDISDALQALVNDVTVKYIKFMLDNNFKTLELFHGACVLKSNNSIIGLTGLNPYLPKQPELEWQFGVPFWGNGYATEIGKAVIKAAFASTDIDLIYGMVNPQNKASMRVMEKIGMTCIGLHDSRGEQDMFYKMEGAKL
jgi:hypothetical protein